MTLAELNKKIEDIEQEAAMRKRTVYNSYVREHAKYKVGDIVSDATDTIKIERISYSVEWRKFVIYYYGSLLTKKGTPRKDGAKRAIFEEHIKA